MVMVSEGRMAPPPPPPMLSALRPLRRCPEESRSSGRSAAAQRRPRAPGLRGLAATGRLRGLASVFGVAVGIAAVAGDPCATEEWAETRQALREAVGDGTAPEGRLAALRQATVAPLQPSACIAGAASLHLVHMLQYDAQRRLQELSRHGEDLLTVLLDSDWGSQQLEPTAREAWPIFGLLHLMQYQLSLDDAAKVARGERWQPLESDDHMRFRNWIYSHLASGQTPPLVDSVHFLARADPRKVHEASKECSAAKAMGYLATALVFVQEQDVGLQRETRELLAAAEAHVKLCMRSRAGDASAFSLRGFLLSEWPLSWLLHTVLLKRAAVAAAAARTQREAPPKPQAAEAARRALQALVLEPPLGGDAVGVAPPATNAAPAAAQQSLPSGAAGDARPSRPAAAGVAQISASATALEQPPVVLEVDVRKVVFRQLGPGLYTAELSQLLEVVGLGARRFVQLFRNGLPLRRAASAEGDCSAGLPRDSKLFWASRPHFGADLLTVFDPDFLRPSVQYTISSRPPVTVGLYLEPGSASDPYNAEWLQAYREAASRLGLRLEETADLASVRSGSVNVWRINQMFQGGRLAGAPGVGAAIADHFQVLSGRGAAMWPRPETMVLYQDKLALRELFQAVGVPAPKSWVATSPEDLDRLLASGELTARDFPLVLKHPYAASSRGMAGCDSLDNVKAQVAAWLAEHRVPCLLQRRVPVSRDLRLTFVGGEIVHGYWRLKPSPDMLTTGTGQGGSRLDFNIPAQELAPFVRDFAARTGVDIGGMDIAFPERPGPDGEGPLVFEVSPIFDLNPEPPPDWAHRPYKEYKETADYKQRRAESYTACAEKILAYALGRRGRLLVDVDNTVSASWERLRRAALPSWPGDTFDSAKAFSASELALDRPLPAAADALRSLTREWEVSFLTARGFPGAYEATARWLSEHGLPCERLIVVQEAREKAEWLEEEVDASHANAELAGLPVAGRPPRPSGRVLLVDDLSRAHHTATTQLDAATIGLLQRRNLPFEIFRPESTDWRQLAERLVALAAAPQPAGGSVAQRAPRCRALDEA
eukprot:TRINITY_DN53979_c0_g1_i1.p1 TRINITY_DN53979_c0_g1~~TRINITY_DN53979_c0_g1_i1.p1  ORF type:complete len:1080 (+),score=235.12 TRINITY_DN53979_c0_g1_i1:79-3240(+)